MRSFGLPLRLCISPQSFIGSASCVVLHLFVPLLSQDFDEVKRVIVLGCDILRYSSARLSISSFARFHFQLDASVFRLFVFV